VKTLEDAERAADELREKWNLGVDAICSLSTVLEDHGVHIIEVEASEKFNGLSAHVFQNEKNPIAECSLDAGTVRCRRQKQRDQSCAHISGNAECARLHYHL
jgi:hypothetical protein